MYDFLNAALEWMERQVEENRNPDAEALLTMLRTWIAAEDVGEIPLTVSDFRNGMLSVRSGEGPQLGKMNRLGDIDASP